MIATLGSEGLSCNRKADGLGGGGGETLNILFTVGTILFTTSNNLLLLCVNFRIVQYLSLHTFQKPEGRYAHG